MTEETIDTEGHTTIYYGIHIQFNMEIVKKDFNEKIADKKYEVHVCIDGVQNFMTFDELKRRLLQD